MNRYNIFVAFTIAFIAIVPAYGYSGAHGSYDDSASAAAASSASADTNANYHHHDNSYHGDIGHHYNGDQYSGNNYGKSYAKDEIVPHQVNKGNTVASSISYPHNKGEILIHRPAAIIVKRPPTKVLVNHPPLVVKPAPVVLHKPPAVVMRKVYVKHHPRPVKVEPVYVNVVKPPAEKYFVNEKQQHYNTVNARPNEPEYAPSYDDNSGYQLLSGNHGLTGAYNLPAAPASYSAGAPAY